MEYLRDNGLVAIAADRDFADSGEILQFFGKPTKFPKGAALLSIKTGAPIVPSFLLRDEGDTFVLKFAEPIYPPKISERSIEDSIIIGLIRKYVTVIENLIRENPTQWMMFRRFWVQ